MAGRFFSLLLCTFLGTLLPASMALAGSGPDVPADHSVYRLLERLDTLGLVNSRTSMIRPLCRAEIARLLLEAKDNASLEGACPSSVIREEIERVLHLFRAEASAMERTDQGHGENYLKPLQEIRVRALHLDGPHAPDGEGGRVLPKGFSMLGRLQAHGRLFDAITLNLDLEVLYNSDNHPDTGGEEWTLRFPATYGKISVINLELLGGTTQPVWGPLGHDSLILSENPESFRLLRISNPHPVLLPWFFSVVGPLRYEAFFTELGGAKHRDVPHPFLAGFRVDARPLPWFEIGFFRTFLFDGKTVSKPGTRDIWRTIFGYEESHHRNEPDVADQRTGLDGRIRFRLFHAGVNLYWEAFGENVTNLIPYQWSTRAGLYLAGFLPGIPALDLRIEWARTHPKAYSNAVYTTGYLYKGLPIGHHVGPDGDDLSVELSWLPLAGAEVCVGYSWETRRAPGPGPAEERHEVTGRFDFTPRDLGTLAFSGFIRYLRIRNPDGIPGSDKEITLSLEVRYEF